MRARMIRHGQTAGNAEKRYIGRTDEPLSPEGIRQAQRAEKDPALEQVFVSPMKRARETASILFPNAEQIVVPDLREMDFGVFEGRSPDEMENDAVYRAWVDGMCLDPCPGGEARADFQNRAIRAFCEIMRNAGEETVFVVHGGIIMAVLGELAVPKREFYTYWVPNLGGYTVDVRFENGVCMLDRLSPFPDARQQGEKV